jgi:chromate transport protein ChrA
MPGPDVPGGPIALTGAMERDLVHLRGWITPAEYKEGLALAQLSPGPLAAQRHLVRSADVTKAHVATL